MHLVVIALAVLMSIGALAARGLFTAAPNADQAFSLRVAQGTWSELSTVAGQRELTSLASFVLLRLWTAVAGDSRASIGMLVGVLYGLAIVATFLLGRRIMNGWIGVLAGLLLAVHGAAIDAASRSVGQLLAMVLTVAAVLMLTRAVSLSTSWCPFLVAAAAAPYSHVYCLPALLAVIAVVVGSSGRGLIFDRSARWAGAALGLAWLPIVVFLMSGRAANSGWVAASALQPDLVARSMGALAGSSVTAVVAATVTLLVVVLIGQVRATVLDDGRALTWSGIPLVLAWSAAPLIVGLVVGIAVPALVPEFLVVAAPAVALAVATGIRLIWAPRLRWAIAALAVGVGTWGVIGTAVDQRSDDWSEVAHLLEARSRLDESVIVEPRYERFALGYLLGRDDNRAAAPAGGGSWDNLPLEIDLQADLRLTAGVGVWLVLGGQADPAASIASIPGLDSLREDARYSTADHLVVHLAR